MLITDGHNEAIKVGQKARGTDEWWIVRWHDDKPLRRETLKGMSGWNEVHLSNLELKRKIKDYLSHPAGISLEAGNSIDRLMRSL